MDVLTYSMVGGGVYRYIIHPAILKQFKTIFFPKTFLKTFFFLFFVHSMSNLLSEPPLVKKQISRPWWDWRKALFEAACTQSLDGLKANQWEGEGLAMFLGSKRERLRFLNLFVVLSCFSRSKKSCRMDDAGDFDESRLRCFSHYTRRLNPQIHNSCSWLWWILHYDIRKASCMLCIGKSTTSLSFKKLRGSTITSYMQPQMAFFFGAAGTKTHNWFQVFLLHSF